MITCSEAIKQATGKDYSLEEVDSFIREAEKIKKRVMLDDKIYDKTAEIQKQLGEATQSIVMAAKIEKRNQLINLKRRTDAVNHITTNFDDYELGLQALLAGTNKVTMGSRLSVDAEQKSLMGQYLGGLAADLDKGKYIKALRSGKLDREIARALWGDTVTGEINDIAAIIAKWQEKSRIDANKAGAWIRKDPNYITRQSHDMDKIHNVKADEYIDFLKSKLDLDKTLEGVEDPEKFFKRLYINLASGVHLKTGESAVDSAFKGSGNLAKKMSQGRVLHFKSADTWMDYNDMFGTGSLMESILHSLDSSAKNTGIMRKLGTNPESMIDVIYQDLSNNLAEQGLTKEMTSLAKFRNDNVNRLMDEVTGASLIPANKMMAQIGSGIRSIQTLSKLGGVILSSFPDVVNYGAEIRYQGGNLLSGIGQSMKGIAKGRQDAEMREIAANMGVGMDSFVGAITSRFSTDDPLPGMLQKGMTLFFKMNGLSWWTDSLKISAAIGTSNRLYQNAGKGYAELSPQMQRVMGLYGISEAEWNVIRNAKQVATNGTGLITPEALLDKRKVTDKSIASIIESQGLTPTKAKIDTLRDELESKVRNYVADRSGYAVLESDVYTQSFLKQGTKRGTLGGEIDRFVSQFKAYPFMYMNKIVGREYHGRAKYIPKDAAMSDKLLDSPAYNIASMFTALTVAGYASMVAKDIAKGREPRDPSDPKTWIAASLQGGGAGIYGDFLFGDMKTRFGGGAISALAGPTAGSFDQAVDLYQRARDGDDFAGQSYKFVLNNTPFLNLFYVRPVLDYLILNDIAESMNSGYLRRMERRIKKENDQEFLFPPSENRLRPVTG